MKCPKCGSKNNIPFTFSAVENGTAYFCGICEIVFGKWQQAEIDRLQRKVGVMVEGLKEYADEDNYEEVETGLGPTHAWFPQHTSNAWDYGTAMNYAQQTLKAAEGV